MEIALRLDRVHAEYDYLEAEEQDGYDLTKHCRCVFDLFGEVKAIDIKIPTKQPGVALTVRKPVNATHHVNDVGDALRRLAAML